MIGTCKLVGLYVQPDQEERDIEGQRSLVPGFAVEVIEVEGRERPGGRRVFEGRIFGLGRREKNHLRPYCTPLRETMRRWWEVPLAPDKTAQLQRQITGWVGGIRRSVVYGIELARVPNRGRARQGTFLSDARRCHRCVLQVIIIFVTSQRSAQRTPPHPPNE